MGDTYNIVIYSGGIHIWSEAAVSASKVMKVNQFIKNSDGLGVLDITDDNNGKLRALIPKTAITAVLITKN